MVEVNQAEIKKAVETKTPAEAAEAPVAEEVPEERYETALDRWRPRTSLGQDVVNRTVTSIDDILKSGRRILEPEIVDRLVPDLKNELILIGGRNSGIKII